MYREKLSSEVARQTKSLKDQLAQKEAEAQNNSNAATILNQFISQGDAELDEMGQVVLTPNCIKNEDSSLMM